ncbi:ribose-5-phosphate isomerase RpiA [Halocalculus aciditolerans]|uniref:Ribose-5-phosphate isomerase A n=1 Tax=Halocalculus aciditolerans TaxID=1383812 RepID=A0A830FE90_9EURY|nr:ribose-5-phosphate isomerase RpiA [Halocalculus aciditolerans]GGL46634.1 ribose-5-phosphate isomerase [Halocalculus aciditolerans]
MEKDTSETAAKRRAGESAAERVEDGMVVGLGTGSTAACAIDALGRRADAGLDIRGVATSFQSRERAKAAGVPLASLDEVDAVDVAIDGADEVLEGGNALVKGGGAAHAREKIVDAFADDFLVVADPSKLTNALSHPVPVEVLPDARTTVSASVEALGGDPVLRAATRKDGPVVTDNGNLVLDCDFGAIDDPAGLATALAGLPGVVEHGLFVGLTDEVHVGDDDGVRVRAL